MKKVNFLREIVAAVEALAKDDLPAPDEDLEAEGYAIAGVLEDVDLRALFLFRSRLLDCVRDCALEQLQYIGEIVRHNPPAAEVAVKQHAMMQAGQIAKARHEVADSLFWAALKTAFPEIVGKSIAVGKDWKVGSKDGGNDVLSGYIVGIMR